MRIIIGCERSGIIREAFKAQGHDAWSCDLAPSSIPGQHMQCDLREALKQKWDFGIFHPPCKLLSSAGEWTFAEKHQNRFPGRFEARERAIKFFLMCYNANIPRICVENPTGYMNTNWKPPTQIIHPFYFGDPHLKRTCLWLRKLPRLNGLLQVASHPAAHRPAPRFIDASGKPRHWIDCQHREVARAKSFPSIAQAMALQWNY